MYVIDAVPVVIDIDDDVEAVLLPSDLVDKVRASVPVADQARMLAAIALLVARVGADEAIGAVDGWLNSPGALRFLPDAVMTLEPLRRR
jgi:hypothetical protein